METIYVVGACRTAIGAFGGSLKDVSAIDLGTAVVKDAMKRAVLPPEAIDEVYFGNVLSAGLGQNVARQVAVKAGIPTDKTAATVSMVCGSGMKAVIDGIRAIASGDAAAVVVGGCENMSSAPYILPTARWGGRMGNQQVIDTMIQDGLWDAFNDYHMGITAENICDQWHLSRKALDQFAYDSQSKAQAALAANRFAEEIVPVQVKIRRKNQSFAEDEYPRETILEKLGQLRPAFLPENGRVTAGNASGINDGAAAMILVNEATVKRYQLMPMAKITGWGQAGVDPAIMGIGPVDASKKALAKAQRTIQEVDLIESNEAFAAQSLAVASELQFDMKKVNVNGGAIALGHPIGASGARIIVTLLHEMQKQADATVGLATLCIGGGMGIATVFEKMK